MPSNAMEDNVEVEIRDNCLQICKDYLGGSWLEAEVDDFVIERIRGGLSNMLYKCSLAERVTLGKGEQGTVLIRLYGQIIHENPETVLTDSVIFSLLAEKNLGPRLHGVFTGGRVEEYVPSRVLRCDELHDADISSVCASKMAQFHKLTMPTVKQPRWLFDTMMRYLDEALNNLSFCDVDDERRDKLNLLMSYNLAIEMETLKTMLENVHSPVMFCHNDFQEGNILYIERPSGGGDNGHNWQLQPIDFEYASYNYRGFDIGNHFCEWCIDYKYNKSPYFTCKIQDYPTTEQQLVFIRAYLQEYLSESVNGRQSPPISCLVGGDWSNESVNQEDVEQFMLMEINTFALASHFLWGLWGIVQSHISDIEFGYLDYALARFDAYFKQKQDVIKQYGAVLCSNGHDCKTLGNHIDC